MKTNILVILTCLLLIPLNLAAKDVDEWNEKAMAAYANHQWSDSVKIAEIAELTFEYATYYHLMNDELAMRYLELVQSLLPEHNSPDLNVLIYRPLLLLSADEADERAFREKYIRYVVNSTSPLVKYKGWMVLGQVGIYDSSALEYLFNALNEVNTDAYRGEQANVYEYISYYYGLHRNRDNQLKYALKSVELAVESSDTRQMIASWKNLGMAYFEAPADDSTDKALEAYHQAMALYTDVVRIQQSDIRSVESLGYMEVLLALGSIYQSRNQADSAILYLNVALKIANANELTETLSFCYKELGVLCHSVQYYTNAEKYLLEAGILLERAAPKTKETEYIDYEIRLMLAKLYHDTGQYEASVAYYESGIAQYRRMFDEEIMNENRIAAAYYEAEKREDDISGLKTIVELKERQRYFYGGIAAVLVGILLIIYRMYSYKFVSVRQREQQLKDAAALLELETAKAELSAHLKQEEAGQLQQRLSAGNGLIEHKNNVLANLKAFIAAHSELSEYKGSIEGIFMQQSRVESNVGEIKTGLKDVPIDFYARLQEQAGNKLTPLDLKYCRLLYQKTPSKKMAEQLFVDLGTIRVTKFRLKRKLKLGKADDLQEFIADIVTSKPAEDA